MTGDVFLTGNSVFVRSLQSDDFGSVMQKWINDREVTQFLWRGTFPANLQELQAEFQSLSGSRTDVQLAIVDQNSNTYIGVVGLHGINWVARHAEFRILIGEKKFWGKGLGTEANQLAVAYAFEILNLNKVWLGVNLTNQRAHQSYLKAGFKSEGTLRQEVFRNGRYHDVARMSLLKSEYEGLKKTWANYPTIQKQLFA